jgi:hypothetical protein
VASLPIMVHQDTFLVLVAPSDVAIFKRQ